MNKIIENIIETRQGDTEQSVTDKLGNSIVEFSNSNNIDGFIYPLITYPLQRLNEDLLFRVYLHLQKIGKQKKMHVLLQTYGGDAHIAFKIGRLLQDYSDELFIHILREAKSAGTLIACASNQIIFSDLSELGPMDPQIALKGDEEQQYSPLAISHTLDLLGEHTRRGNLNIVEALADKLPDPLLLGEHIKVLETGKDYLEKLLNKKMFNDNDDAINQFYTARMIKKIANQLVSGYPSHGYCIDLEEAHKIGLDVKAIEEDEDRETIFNIIQNYKSFSDKYMYQDYLEEAGRDEETRPIIPPNKDLPTTAELETALHDQIDRVIDHQLQKNVSSTAPKIENS